MKILWLCICVFGAIHGSYATLPTIDEVKAAFLTARMINQMKTDLNQYDRDFNKKSTAQCPLSMAHGKRSFGDPNTDRKMNNALLATKLLIREGKFSLEELNHESVRKMFGRENGDSCAVATTTDPCNKITTYRRADGSCNNLNHPDWGLAGISQERVLSSEYADGLGLPKTTGFANQPLPNARTVSNVINKNPNTEEKPSPTLTLHAMGFGQFLDHDMMMTPEQSVVDDCCAEKNKDDTDNCFNIIIEDSTSEDSAIFKKGYCMEVKRSAPVLCPDATSNGAAVRQQKNGITAFIDASNVYGSSLAKQQELRSNGGTGYLLKTKKTGTPDERLPYGGNDACTLSNAAVLKDQHCSMAGDDRVNEVPGLTAYHYLFLKEHNRIAEKIKDFFTDDETIFQEARKIVIAVMQKITYLEFLPSFFSPAGLKEHQLNTDDYVYEENTDPSMVNSVGIAFRFGHSWVSKEVVMFNRDLKPIVNPVAKQPLENTFFRPDMTYLPDAFKTLAYWFSGATSTETDRIIEEAIRSRLFIEANKAWDLAALNMQRGRDHGLPSYGAYRSTYCGLSPLNDDWNGNGGLIDHNPDVRALLQKAGYKSPHDIDLWIGGLTEKPVPGGSIGPTFECILGRHFRRLRFGDRLFYQNTALPVFNNDQIQAIQAYSFAKLLCNNYNFREINVPNAFKSNDPRKPCSGIKDLDFNVFNPNQKGQGGGGGGGGSGGGGTGGGGPQKNVRTLDEQLEKLIDELENEMRREEVSNEKI